MILYRKFQRLKDSLISTINNEAGLVTVFAIVFGFIALQLILALSIVIESETTNYENIKIFTKAENIAEAGLNAYLANLQNNSDYITTNPQLGPVSFGGGEYIVNAYEPTLDEPYIKLISTGTIVNYNNDIRKRSLEIKLGRPSFADYMFLSDDNMRFGRNAEVYGYIHSNKSIIFDGLAHNKVTASGSITGIGTFEEGYQSGVPPIDFNSVIIDIANIKQDAQTSGEYLPPATGYLGYYIKLNSNGTFDVNLVTNEDNNGISSIAYRLISIPSNGLIYIDDNFWIDGSIKGRFTFTTPQNIYIKDNLTYSGTSGAMSLGLIAQKEIILPVYSSSYLEINAALLAQSGSIHSNFQTGNIKNKLVITGSMAYKTQGGFALVDGDGTVVAGYKSRIYTYDQYLNIYPPPAYPILKSGQFKIISWRKIIV